MGSSVKVRFWLIMGSPALFKSSVDNYILVRRLFENVNNNKNTI